MKNKLLLPKILFAVTILSTAINAQTIPKSYNGNEISVTTDTLARLLLFTGRYVEDKTYLHWDVECQKEDGIYFIYRSVDDLNYELLGSKQGVGVPVFFPTAYYFQDEHPPCGTAWYVLVHINKKKEYIISEKIRVERPNLISCKK